MKKIRVTEEEFEKAIDSFLEKARHAPVFITRDGQDHLVLLSIEEYNRLALRSAQDFFTTLAPADVQLSEELIRERREDAERE